MYIYKYIFSHMAIERLCRRDKGHGTAEDTGGSWFQNHDFDTEKLGWYIQFKGPTWGFTFSKNASRYLKKPRCSGGYLHSRRPRWMRTHLLPPNDIAGGRRRKKGRSLPFSSFLRLPHPHQRNGVKLLTGRAPLLRLLPLLGLIICANQRYVHPRPHNC